MKGPYCNHDGINSERLPDWEGSRQPAPQTRTCNHDGINSERLPDWEGSQSTAMTASPRVDAAWLTAEYADFDNIFATPPSVGNADAARWPNAGAWSSSKHDEIIKRLMSDIGQPNSTSVYGAFKQFANELHALAALSAAPVSAWQDISTAPKDGTVILLASTDERGSKNLIECSWWSEERCWIDNGRRGKPDEYEADWYQVDNTDFSFSRPTHWRMPLSRPRHEGKSHG